MIKVENNIATRESLPTFLQGLHEQSLVDLSWTDPALGVSSSMWWPEENQSLPLGQFQKYGTETLTPNTTLKVVVSVCDVVPMDQDEIDSLTANQAQSVRSERTNKLSKTDWTQLNDAPVDKAAWATYRQALRDVTAQSGFPWTVTWPDAP